MENLKGGRVSATYQSAPATERAYLSGSPDDTYECILMEIKLKRGLGRLLKCFICFTAAISNFTEALTEYVSPVSKSTVRRNPRS
jgi:hypothetical protein